MVGLRSLLSVVNRHKTWDILLADLHTIGVAFAGAAFVVDCVITLTITKLLHGSKTEYVE
jgi:hypothetical protein